MIEASSKTIGGIKMRPFSIGSKQVADLLGLTMFTGGEATSEIELQRQINTFVWMQSAPLDEVAEAVANNTAGKAALIYSLGLDLNNLPDIIAEIERIGQQVAANEVRVESKHKSSQEDEPPGKSLTLVGAPALSTPSPRIPDGASSTSSGTCHSPEPSSTTTALFKRLTFGLLSR